MIHAIQMGCAVRTGSIESNSQLPPGVQVHPCVRTVICSVVILILITFSITSWCAVCRDLSRGHFIVFLAW